MKLAWRLFWREWRGGELGLLLASLLLGIGIVTGVSLFSERLQRALVGEAGNYLGADRVLQSSVAIQDHFLQAAGQHRLQVAHTIVFPTMAYHGDLAALASLKVVSPGYPLKGSLEIERQGTQFETVRRGPAAGHVWIDRNIAAQLGVETGQRIELGSARLLVDAILLREGDAGSSFYGMGPRVMMAEADLPASQLLMPGSRVEHRYLFAGEPVAVEQYVAWLKPQLQPGQRLLSLEENQPGIAGALDKATVFLQLAGSLGVMLAALAGGFAAQRYCERHVDTVAILKTLGVGRAQMMQLLMAQLGILWVLAVAGGALAGLLLQQGLLRLLDDWVPADLPAAGAMPFMLGGMTGLVCLLAFVMPAMLRLQATPPSQVLRQSRWQTSLQRLDIVWMLSGVFVLLCLYSGSPVLVVYLLAGFGLLAGIILVLVRVLLAAPRQTGMQAHSAWWLGMSNARRRGGYSILQVVVFATGFMLLSIMVLLRTSLLQEWRLQVPEDAPNTFLINVPPEQTAPLQQALTDAGIRTAGMYPMVRGRLVRINGQQATELFDESVSELYRELNLSWTASLPEGNRVTGGQWFQSGASRPEVSVEEGLAKRLRLSLGDRLVFSMAGSDLEVEVSSFRSLHWDSMKPNFYFLFPPGQLDRFSSTGMTSLHADPAQKPVLARILRQYPAVTAYPVDELIARIRSIMERASLAVELVMLLVLLAGALVLVSCVRASLDERMQESALLRTLGATRSRVIGSLAIEFLVLGGVAGALAAAGAELSAWAMQTRLLKMAFQPHPALWVTVPFACACLMSLVGTLFCYRTVTSPPQVILRETLG